ncbi:MAG: DEAD/DEAH box helicase [Methanomicrobiales archaeon]|nr:DEAD/DEAH box helicase [Methanomicrobiales archaeon]
MLGAKVHVAAERYERRDVAAGASAGTITVLNGIRTSTSPEKPVRIVAPQWHQRVTAAISSEYSLREYQVEGAAWMASRLATQRGGGVVLADDPGLGKTVQTIAAVTAANVFPLIIVCPTSIKSKWRSEFNKFSAADMRPSDFQILEKRRGPIYATKITILNSHILRHREQDLLRLRAKCLVIDEAHDFKEFRPRAGHRAAVATRLVENIGRTILLTGTPVMNRIREMWRLLYMCDMVEWRNYEDFHARYVRAPTDEEKAVEQPYRNIVTSAGRVERIDELRVRAAPYMLRRKKGEVEKDMPPKTRQSITVQLDTLSMHQYRLAESDIVAWLKKKGSVASAARATRALAFVKLTHLRRLAALGKLREAVPDYLRKWFGGGKAEPLVIFAHHSDVVTGTVKICHDMGLRTSLIMGGVDGNKRQQAVDDFMSGKTDVFAASYMSAAEGIDLFRASDSLHLERLWVPAKLQQAEDRIHRIGQTRPVTNTYMDAEDTIDQYMAHTLDAKRVVIDAALDETSEAFRNVFDVASRLAASPAATTHAAEQGSGDRPILLPKPSRA